MSDESAPALATSDDWTWMSHPEVEGPPVRVHRDALEIAHSQNGWVEADAPDTDSPPRRGRRRTHTAPSSEES